MPSTNTVAAAWKTCLLPEAIPSTIVAMEAAEQRRTDRKQAQGARVPSVVMHIVTAEISLWLEHYLNTSVLSIPKLFIKVGSIFQSARIGHHE